MKLFGLFKTPSITNINVTTNPKAGRVETIIKKLNIFNFQDFSLNNIGDVLDEIKILLLKILKSRKQI